MYHNLTKLSVSKNYLNNHRYIVAVYDCFLHYHHAIPAVEVSAVWDFKLEM